MTKQELYRLSPATVIEPLVNRWSAWANLISPVTASLHLQRHQLTILRDYLEDPVTHARLARDPEFAGGPFADIPPSRAGEIKELVLTTEDLLKDNLRFAEAIADFYNWFVDEARGQALEPYYDQLPSEMRGYVELVYDYFNQPAIRFFEGLLYRSRYYNEGLQSLRLFSLRHDNERPFFMSTPRLQNAGEIDWQIPFADPLVDELCRLDLRPQPLEFIAEMIGPSAADQQVLLPLLTKQAGTLAERWLGPRARLRYFGHACVLVESHGYSLLTDPFVPARPGAGGMARFSYDDLPEKVDCVLVTHNHQDHFVLETLLRLRSRIECLIVPKASGHLFGDISLKLLAQKLNFKSVVELDAMESFRLLPDLEIVAIPFLGEHGDLAHSKTGYVIRVDQEQLMFGADSDCLDRQMYDHVRRALGPVQTVFIGTESVGAPLTWNNGHLFLRPPTREQDQTRRYRGCDSASALDLLEALGAKRIFNYAMGREPWLEHLLGLGLGEDAPQRREGRRLVQRAHGRGFLAAESLFGSTEIFIETKSSRRDAPLSGQPANPETVRPHLSSPRDDWRDYFAGALDAMIRPRDLERFSQTGATGARSGESPSGRAASEFPFELARALVEFESDRKCDRYLLFMAVAATVFARANGQDEVVIDTVLTNGNLRLAELPEPVVPKNSVLRIDLSGDLSFMTLSQRMQEIVGRAALRPAITFDELAGLLRPSPSDKSTPPFRLRFVFNAVGAREPSPATVPAEGILNGLALTVVAKADSFTAFVDFDRSVVDERFATNLLNDYQTLLSAVVAYPEQAIAHLPIRVEDRKVFAASARQSRDSEDQFNF